MNVVWTPEAADDLDTILAFIAARSPAGAASVAAAIDHSLQTISEFPRAGRLDAETGAREWPIPGLPLLVIYIHDETLVEVIAFFHTSRDPAEKRTP